MSRTKRPTFPLWFMCSVVSVVLAVFAVTAIATAFGYVADNNPLYLSAALAGFVIGPVLGIEAVSFLNFLQKTPPNN